MLYDEYVRIIQEVSQCVDAQDYETSLRLLNDLLKSDLPDLDKCIMAINVAVVWDKRGDSSEALRWYDRAIRFEKSYDRFFAQEKKAAYFLYLGRKKDALLIYQELLKKPFLNLSEQDRMRSFILQIEGTA